MKLPKGYMYDPTRGYGGIIESMLDGSNAIGKKVSEVLPECRGEMKLSKIDSSSVPAKFGWRRDN